jgi:hypothetical protein
MIESDSPSVKYREPLLLFHQDGVRLSDVSARGETALGKNWPARESGQRGFQ